MYKFLRIISLSILVFCLINTNVFAQHESMESLTVETLKQKITDNKQVLVVNFWSTWCKPCIDEIPHFIKVGAAYKSLGVDMLFVSLDTEKMYKKGGLKKWLNKRDWNIPVAWLNESNADVFCPAIDANWSGVIPATLVVNNTTGYRSFTEAALTENELVTAIKKALVQQN